MKKTRKNQNPKSEELSGPKTPLTSGRLAMEPSRPVFMRVGKSVGTFLNRTKVYFTSMTNAKI